MLRLDVLFTAVTPLNYKTSRTTKIDLTLFCIHEMALRALDLQEWGEGVGGEMAPKNSRFLPV